MDNHERILGPACGWVSLLTMASDAAMGTVAGEGDALHNDGSISISEGRPLGKVTPRSCQAAKNE
jgi:hypothetical protein